MIIMKPLIIDTYLDQGRITKGEVNRNGIQVNVVKIVNGIIQYKGIYVPWSLGGYGYILSKKSISIILENDFNMKI